MPDVVLPATISSELADVLRRLTALESSPPAGMTALASTTFSSGAFAWIATWANMNTTSLLLPALLRPVPLLIVGSANFYASGGTATYGAMRMIVTDSLAHTTPLKDVSGNPITSDLAFCTNGSGISTPTFVIVATLPAQAASASMVIFQYVLWPDTSNTTTVNLPGPLLATDTCSIEVFQLAG